eukprot:2988025-Prymnesium_polylepis.1
MKGNGCIRRLSKAPNSFTPRRAIPQHQKEVPEDVTQNRRRRTTQTSLNTPPRDAVAHDAHDERAAVAVAHDAPTRCHRPHVRCVVRAL